MKCVLSAARASMFVGITLAALACGGGGDSPPTGNNPPGNNNPPGGSTSTSITVSNNQFTPSSTTVPVNSTVTWTWATGASTHNVTFTSGPTGPNSVDQNTGTFVRQFTVAGTYAYRCTIHGASMSGTVIVQ